MRLRSVVLLVLGFVPAAFAQDVPREYRALYDRLSMTLDAFERRLESAPAGEAPVYAAELLVANANRGTALLAPETLEATKLYLDRLQQLGVRGVVFPVGYPMLLPEFPHSDRYLDYYRSVMAEARKRGMTVDIESAVLFTNTDFSDLKWDYSAIGFDEFVRGRRAVAATILRELAPDYLDLGAEPDTMAKLTGYRQLNDPKRYAESLTAILSGLDRGRTKIGAGIGTWSSIEFARAELATPIDFLALHMYPVGRVTIQTAAEACRLARAAGKPVIIDEEWLYKMGRGEGGSIAASTKVFSRDAYSFWMPLDQQFFRVMDRFARAEHIELVSPFWTNLFFGNIDYDRDTASLPYAEIVKRVNRAAMANLTGGKYTPTGAFYGRLAAQSGR